MATRAATRAAHLAPSFVLGLPSLCSFAQAAISQAQRALSCLILCFLFSSVVCRVLCRPLRQHNSAISTTPEASLQEHDGSMSTTLTYIEKCGCETAENYICHNVDIVIQQIRMYLWYDVQIHMWIQTLLAFNTLIWGSLRLTPLIYCAYSIGMICIQ